MFLSFGSLRGVELWWVHDSEPDNIVSVMFVIFDGLEFG